MAANLAYTQAQDWPAHLDLKQYKIDASKKLILHTDFDPDDDINTEAVKMGQKTVNGHTVESLDAHTLVSRPLGTTIGYVYHYGRLQWVEYHSVWNDLLIKSRYRFADGQLDNVLVHRPDGTNLLYDAHGKLQEIRQGTNCIKPNLSSCKTDMVDFVPDRMSPRFNPYSGWPLMDGPEGFSPQTDPALRTNTGGKRRNQ